MKKMNCRILAATLLAVQIAVTAMPATALAAENDQVQEMVQEQAEAPTEAREEAPIAEAQAPVEEEEPAPVETAAPAEEPEEVAATQTQKESAVEEAEETEEAKTQETEKATTETSENTEETKASEKPAEGKSFDQTVTVDRVKIKVTAEEGAFEEGAKLTAVRVPSTQLKEVENAVADARVKDELVKSAYAFDIKIVDQAGNSLQPAAGKKVKVSFGTEEAADGSLSAVVYHIVGPKDNIKAQKLATTVNREAKAAEAQTTGLSYYVVEFVSKSSTDANTDSNVPAKTEPADDTDKTAKTETTEDTNTTGKTETVTPAAKDTEKSNTETSAVKKETKTETKKSEVKKSENKKKEKASSKKTEKAKTNTKKSPKTGDTSNMVIWITTSLLAVGGIIVLLLARRKLR